MSCTNSDTNKILKYNFQNKTQSKFPNCKKYKFFFKWFKILPIQIAPSAFIIKMSVCHMVHSHKFFMGEGDMGVVVIGKSYFIFLLIIQWLGGEGGTDLCQLSLKIPRSAPTWLLCLAGEQIFTCSALLTSHLVRSSNGVQEKKEVDANSGVHWNTIFIM